MKDDLTPGSKQVIRAAVAGKAVSDLIKNDFFANKMPLPHRVDFFKGLPCQCCGKAGDVDQEVAKAAYKSAHDDRRRHENLQNRRFKYACFYELGLEGMWHSKPAKITWEIAWSDGHSAGLYEVYNRFCELSRILNVM